MIERDKEFSKAIDEIVAGIEFGMKNYKMGQSKRKNQDKKNQS